MLSRKLSALGLMLILAAAGCATSPAPPPEEPAIRMAESRPLSPPVTKREVKPAPQIKFAGNIAAYEARDKISLPPQEAILFIGSSSFVGWKTLEADMAPLPVFNRAFGGSRTAEVNHYAPRVVLPYRPKIIAYYTGDNDLAKPENPIVPAIEGFVEFVAIVHQALPKTRIFYVSIKPSPSRIACWPNAMKANSAIASFCETDPRLTFVDISPTLLGADGKPDPARFKSDMLHFKAEIYSDWTKLLKPLITKAWREMNHEE